LPPFGPARSNSATFEGAAFVVKRPTSASIVPSTSFVRLAAFFDASAISGAVCMVSVSISVPLRFMLRRG
jgi:hypothetical protein